MIWLLLIGVFMAGAILGLLYGGLVGGARHDEAQLLEAIEELSQAVREAYNWIHVAGDWAEFSESAYTVPSQPTTVRQIVTDQPLPRARGREWSDDRPLGHTRVGIDEPAVRWEFHRYVVQQQQQSPHDWQVIDTDPPAPTELPIVLASFGDRTNWIDNEPYGPEAAAREFARRMNDPDISTVLVGPPTGGRHSCEEGRR